jgi:hypothetical protein
MVQKVAGNRKGGARNYKKEQIPMAELLMLMQQHHLKVGSPHCFDFRSYYKKPRSNAINAVDLLHTQVLLKKFMKVAPTASLHYSALKQSFSKFLAAEKPVLATFQLGDNQSVSAYEVAGHLADSILCALAHVRRLKNNEKWQQACSKLDDDLVEELKSLRDAYSGTTACEVAEDLPTTQDVLNSCADIDSSSELPATQDLLKFAESETDSLLEEALRTAVLPVKKKAIEEIIESKKRPAASSSVAMKRPGSSLINHKQKQAASSSSVAMKRPASSLTDDSGSKDWMSKSFGRLNITNAKAQSYIQYKKDGKKTLLVAVSCKQSEHHEDICAEIALWVCNQDSLTKDQVVAFRNSLFSE